MVILVEWHILKQDLQHNYCVIYKELIIKANKNIMSIGWTSISQNILVLSFDTSFNYSNERFVHTKYVDTSLDNRSTLKQEYQKNSKKEN